MWLFDCQRTADNQDYIRNFYFWLCTLMQVSSMTQLCLCVCIFSVWLYASLGLPPQHRGWLRLWEEGEGCRECIQRLCPPVPGECPAGRVQDHCGCCEQCANVEGQQCDPDGAQKFYGNCGEGLICQRKMPKGGHKAAPEPTCVCQEKGPVCSSDGWTYQNVCQMREAGSRSNTTIKLTGRGPCNSGYCSPLLQIISLGTFMFWSFQCLCIVVLIGNIFRGTGIEPWGAPFLLLQLPASFKFLETCPTTPGMTSCLAVRPPPTLFQTSAGGRQEVTTSCQEMILTSLSRFDMSLVIMHDWNLH